MPRTQLILGLFFTTLCFSSSLFANLIPANPSNYTSHLNTLVSGDTLALSPGIYSNNLTLNNLNGTFVQPIVILGSGNTTVFQGQSCCNTVSLTKCSYVVLKHFELDGLNESVDAIKAEGTSGNWTHHITIEYVHIVHYSASQQNVGISTKCAAWNWVVRKNKIEDVGTGMYFGNSDGTKPFVNGIIEYNYIANTIGYNIEIKHQLNNVRDEFSGTAVDGKSIIRHNVFSKGNNSSSGGNARPNLLVGGFPLTGWGAMDYYEIYGNFFYNNPVEALFQGTGNIHLYKNIFVNHFDPSGFRAVYITPHNGVSPQDVHVFHNTVWVKNNMGGIRLYNPNPAYTQSCIGNVVFSSAPITNFNINVDNITDDYANAGNYVLSADLDIDGLNLMPQNGKTIGPITADSLFKHLTDWNIDFNGDTYDWTYRGAYTGCCTNNGWMLQLDTMPTLSPATTPLNLPPLMDPIHVLPNPVTDIFSLYFDFISTVDLTLYDLWGRTILSDPAYPAGYPINISNRPAGIYYLVIKHAQQTRSMKILKQ